MSRTYTAYTGFRISQQLLETTHIQSVVSKPIFGPAAANKGSGAVSPADSRSLRGYVEIGPRIEHDRLLGSCELVGERIWMPAADPAWEALQLGNFRFAHRNRRTASATPPSRPCRF